MTRLGYHFLFVGSFALIGGALRGFNLLLILAGLVIGILLMQWRWSTRSLEQLTVSRRLPSEAFAGRPFQIVFLIRSASRFLPVWMLRVEEIISSPLIVNGIARKRGQGLRKSGATTKVVCGVDVVPPGMRRTAHVDCTISRRGLYELGPTRLASCFPFSLMTGTKRFAATKAFYVFPRLLPIKPNWTRVLTCSNGGDATSVKRNGGGQGEFFGLREWQSGDSTQLIHWRTTARTGVPVVRQFEQKRSFNVCLLLDTSPSDKRIDLRSNTFGDDVPFERAVSLAASLLCRLEQVASNRFVLAVPGNEISGAGILAVQNEGLRGSNAVSMRQMLQLLATATPIESPDLSKTIGAMLQAVGRVQDIIVISTRSMNEAILSDDGLRDAVSALNRTSMLRWVNVQSPDFDLFVSSERSSKLCQEIAL